MAIMAADHNFHARYVETCRTSSHADPDLTAAWHAVSPESRNGVCERILGCMEPSSFKEKLGNAGAKGRVIQRSEFMVQFCHSTRLSVLSVMMRRLTLSPRVRTVSLLCPLCLILLGVNGTIKTPSHVSWATRFTNPRNIAHDGIGPHTIGVVSGLSPGDPALMAPLGSWVGQSSVVSPGSRIDLTTAIAPSSQTDRAVSLDVTPDTSIQARLTYNGLRPTEVELLMHKAKDLEDKKQFPEAYILYKEVIYGFEHFHGLTHFVTIKAILTFASFCISQDIFHEAEDILLKALEAAEAMGTAHSTALELKAYLGRSYTQLGRFGEGEILLKDAKNKIEAMYVDDPKSAFLETRAIDEHLITVYTTRDDFKAAEQEYLRLISKVKTHWVAHHHVSVDLRHNLAHMYQNWRMREEYHQLEFQPTLPCHRAEHNSLELIQLLEQYHEDSRTNNKILCQYDLLRLQYHEINEDEKLERLLERIENFLNRFQTVKAAGSAPLTAGLARSFEKLGMHHKDDWWYTHSQENVDDLHGPNSETAFGQRHQPWVIYLRRGLWPQAEVCFLRAQETASIVLSVDDPLRAKIAKLLRERVWIASCSKCMIR